MIQRMIVDFIIGMFGGLFTLVLFETVKVMRAWLRTEDDLQ